MSHSEIAELSGVVGVVVDHGHAEISALSGFTGAADHGHSEITELRGFSGVASTGSHVEFTDISGVVAIPGALQARAGLDIQVSSFTDVVLDGSSSTGAWVSASWTLVSDSRVAPAAPFPTTLTAITPDPDFDSVITIQFPAHPETYTVVLRLTVTDGVTTSTDTKTVTVWAWVFWRVQGTSLVPKTRYRIGNALPPVVSAGSGVPMPGGTIVDSSIGQTWIPLTSNDFNTDIPLGGFTTRTTGSDLGLLDPASPGGAVYGAAWKAKQAESPDTSGFAKYSAARTMSVSNSILDIWLHTENSQAYGSAMKPLLPQANPNFLGYCRIDFRMRSTGIVGSGFGAVALLINNNQWSQSVEGWGEDDWPEVQLGGPVGGNRHFTHPVGVADTFTSVSGGGLQMTDWHTYSIQWFAQAGVPRVIYKADGVTYFDSTDRVAAAPRVLGFLVQTASNGAGAVSATAQGHLQIDWYSIWTAA